MKKFNFSKIALYALDIILVLVLVGGIFLGFLGYNKPVSAKGGVEVRVTLDEKYHDEKLMEKAQEDIEEIIEKNDYKIISDTRVESFAGTYNTLVFFVEGGDYEKYYLETKEDGSVYAQIKAYLEGKTPGFVFDNEEKVEEFKVDLVSSSFSYKIFQKTLIGMAIMLVAVLVYFLIRFKVASTLASLSAILIEFLLFNAVVLITRIPTDGVFYIVLYSILILSVLSSLVYNSFYRLALNGAEEKTLEEHTQDIIFKAGKVIVGIFGAIILALLVAIIAVPGSLKVTFALIALGALLVGAVSVFVRPALRYWFGLINLKKKTGYAVHAKQKETKV